MKTSIRQVRVKPMISSQVLVNNLTIRLQFVVLQFKRKRLDQCLIHALKKDSAIHYIYKFQLHKLAIFDILKNFFYIDVIVSILSYCNFT